MNERIRELNMQAAEYATSVCPTHSRDWYPIQNTKFAELIVRECMSVADLPKNLSGQWDHLESSEVIARHFGVEQ